MNKRHPENLSIDILKPFLLPLRIEQKAGFLQFPFGSKEVIPKLKKYGVSSQNGTEMICVMLLPSLQ